MRKFVALSICMMIFGCSSVETISTADPIPDASCQVKVFQTQAQALKVGPIDEMCIINGTSSGSFSHTIATAIDKHKNKACACGAQNVYIESRTQSGMDVATVTMVAFKFIKK